MDEVGVISAVNPTTITTKWGVEDTTTMRVTVFLLGSHHFVGTAIHPINLLKSPRRNGLTLNVHAMTAVLGVAIPTHGEAGGGMSIADKGIEISDANTTRTLLEPIAHRITGDITPS